MTRDRFRDLFIRATERVLVFTRHFVVNEIPDTPRYLVHANQSHDRLPDGTSATAFPEDSLPYGQFRGPMTGVEAIDFLWRDERAPVWIDVSVVGVENGMTLIELYCAGRYTEDESGMYYATYDMGPFGVKGPALPPGYDSHKSEKFDLYWREKRQSPEQKPAAE